jgi:hypothetical protein
MSDEDVHLPLGSEEIDAWVWLNDHVIDDHFLR